MRRELILAIIRTYLNEKFSVGLEYRVSSHRNWFNATPDS